MGKREKQNLVFVMTRITKAEYDALFRLALKHRMHLKLRKITKYSIMKKALSLFVFYLRKVEKEEEKTTLEAKKE